MARRGCKVAISSESEEVYPFTPVSDSFFPIYQEVYALAEMPDFSLWGPAELAAFLMISTDTIYRRRSRYPESLPPAIKAGRKIYWVPSEVLAWCEQHRGGSTGVR